MAGEPPGFRFGMVVSLVLGVVVSSVLIGLAGWPQGLLTILLGFVFGGLFWGLLRPVYLRIGSRGLDGRVVTRSQTTGAATTAGRPTSQWHSKDLWVSEDEKRLHEEKDVAGLRAILMDTHRPGPERRYAAAALGDIGDAAAVPDLIAMLPDLEVRGLAAEALGALGDLRAAGPLMLYARSENPIVAASFRTAFDMLVQPDPDAWQAANDAFRLSLDEGAARFGAHCEEPVETLAACHICGAPFTMRLTHSVWCRPCNVYFSDAEWLPNVSTGGDGFGQLLSESMDPYSMLTQPSPMAVSFGLSRRQQARVGLAWRLRENYSTEAGCSLATFGGFVKKALQSMPVVAPERAQDVTPRALTLATEAEHVKALEVVAAQPMALTVTSREPNDSVSTFAIKRDGTLWAWGANDGGQLGLGDRDDRYTPTQVSKDAGWGTVVADGAALLAIKRDGTLWAWGVNRWGQLGLGDRDEHHKPTQVGSDSDWMTVVTGTLSSFAIKCDGTLWAWGHNGVGQLGLGDCDDRHTPTRVGSDSDWVTVTTQLGRSFAIKRDGSLWAWGHNQMGYLGLGDGDHRDTPTRVGSDSDWVAVVTGGALLAIQRDSTLWAWGDNGVGQLGLGDRDDRYAPAQVGSDSDWMTVATWGPTSFAIKRDGALYAWGNNRRGQLGLGDRDDRYTPTQVDSGSDWMTVTGKLSAFAIKRDGTLWAWGHNGWGQLGLGDRDDRATPTQVGHDSDWV